MFCADWLAALVDTFLEPPPGPRQSQIQGSIFSSLLEMFLVLQHTAYFELAYLMSPHLLTETKRGLLVLRVTECLVKEVEGIHRDRQQSSSSDLDLRWEGAQKVSDLLALLLGRGVLAGDPDPYTPQTLSTANQLFRLASRTSSGKFHCRLMGGHEERVQTFDRAIIHIEPHTRCRRTGCGKRNPLYWCSR